MDLKAVKNRHRASGPQSQRARAREPIDMNRGQPEPTPQETERGRVGQSEAVSGGKRRMNLAKISKMNWYTYRGINYVLQICGAVSNSEEMAQLCALCERI